MSYILLLSLNVAIMFQFVSFYTRWISYNVVHSQSQGIAPINLNEHTLNLSLTFLLCIYLFFFSINVSSSKLYGPRAWVELPVYKYNACNLRYIEIWCFIYYIIVVLFIDMHASHDFHEEKNECLFCLTWQ